MVKKIIIKESSLSLLTENNTIQLQLINGYFYPIDFLGKNILANKYNLERIPENAFDRWSPRFVSDGYKLAVSGYDPKPSQNITSPIGSRIGGEPKSVKNPCLKCKMGGLCDSDECGMKNFKLFKK